jgi:hypothetical protein
VAELGSLADGTPVTADSLDCSFYVRTEQLYKVARAAKVSDRLVHLVYYVDGPLADKLVFESHNDTMDGARVVELPLVRPDELDAAVARDLGELLNAQLRFPLKFVTAVQPLGDLCKGAAEMGAKYIRLEVFTAAGAGGRRYVRLARSFDAMVTMTDEDVTSTRRTMAVDKRTGAMVPTLDACDDGRSVAVDDLRWTRESVNEFDLQRLLKFLRACGADSGAFLLNIEAQPPNGEGAATGEGEGAATGEGAKGEGGEAAASGEAPQALVFQAMVGKRTGHTFLMGAKSAEA